MTKIEELRAAFNAVTGGEWETSCLCTDRLDKEWAICREGGGDMLADLTSCENPEVNAHFIALAHNNMPALLEAVEALKLVCEFDNGEHQNSWPAIAQKCQDALEELK